MENNTIDSFNVTQRRFLAENFKDALVNANPQGERYFSRLGPTVQATLRESVLFTCLYKPLKGKVVEEKIGDNGESKEFVVIKIDVFQPGTNDKITLERKFTKSYLEQQ